MAGGRAQGDPDNQCLTLKANDPVVLMDERDDKWSRGGPKSGKGHSRCSAALPSLPAEWVRCLRLPSRSSIFLLLHPPFSYTIKPNTHPPIHPSHPGGPSHTGPVPCRAAQPAARCPPCSFPIGL